MPIDAQVLLAHVVARDRAWLAAHRDETARRAQADAFFALAKRRRDGEPVAYLTGVSEFWGLPLRVTPAVLIPRPRPRRWSSSRSNGCRATADARVLDLGDGLGRDCAGDRARAAAGAGDRHRRVGRRARGRARQCAAASACQRRIRANPTGTTASRSTAPFDVIVSNPPYVAPGDPHLREGDVRFEPRGALVAGRRRARGAAHDRRGRAQLSCRAARSPSSTATTSRRPCRRCCATRDSRRSPCAATWPAFRGSWRPAPVTDAWREARYLQITPGAVTDSAQLVTSGGALRASPMRVSA